MSTSLCFITVFKIICVSPRCYPDGVMYPNADQIDICNLELHPNEGCGCARAKAGFSPPSKFPADRFEAVSLFHKLFLV